MKIVVSSEELESNKTSIQEKLNQTIKSEMSTSTIKMLIEQFEEIKLFENLLCKYGQIVG